MKKLLLASAFALLCTSAMARDVYQFGINGGTARVEIPRSCRDISCINFSWSENAKSESKKAGKTQDKSGTTAKTPDAPEQKPVAQEPAPPPAPPTPSANAVNVPPPPPAPEVTPPAPPTPPSTQNTPPPFPSLPSSRLTELSPDRPAPTPPPATEPIEPKTQVPNEPKTQVAVVTPKPEPAPAAKPAPTGPIGTWLTEKGEGKIRIEECGTALCGVDVNAKPGAKHILSNMKPTEDNRWSGKIYDPKSGNTYTGRMSMKNPDSLRVEGCAFGGMICGGQTWKRVE